ncbi:unnamed protein product [Peniophora sp. CBMAI 1063]|nr:unnamed protein product [Peniophora sp. CBMAI 1063]
MVVATRSRAIKPHSPTPKGRRIQIEPTPRILPAIRTTRRKSPPKISARACSHLDAPKEHASKSKRAKLLPSEYELDEDGNAIENPLTGCPKLSKYGWRVLAESTRHVEMARPALPELDGRLRPRYGGSRQPILHYATGCHISEILEWERQKNYPTRSYNPYPDDNARHRLCVYLNGRRINCTIERVLSPDFEFAVALYSNHDQFEKELVKEDEDRCLRIIWEQLGIHNRRPLWYWDSVQSGTHYKCTLDEYNVPNLHNIMIEPEDEDWV